MTRNIINSTLNSEILFKIFEYTSNDDLLQCLKVCKTWYLLTKPLFWETIQLESINQVNGFLKYDQKNNTKFTKCIVLGYPYDVFYSLQYTLTKEQLKQILFRLPNIEEIKINISCGINLAELNNYEFLNEFRKSCPLIKSFEVLYGFDYEYINDYTDILYSLRHTLTNINILNNYSKLYEQINSFPRLEHFSYDGCYSESDTLLELLYKIKTLPCLKSFNFGKIQKNLFDNDELISINMHDIHLKTEQDDIFQQKLASIKKINLNVCNYNILRELDHYIQQYCIGLKSIEINYMYIPYYDGFNKRLDFIYSHNQYKVSITGDYFMTSCNSIDIVPLFLQNHYNNLPLKCKNIIKEIQIELDGTDAGLTYYDMDSSSPPFKIQVESKQVNNNQFLKSSRLYSACSEMYGDIIYEILNPTLTFITDIGTLVFKIYGYDHFPFKSFKLIGKILHLMTDSLKRVTFYIQSGLEWCNYFVKYEKIKTHSHVTHLKIFVDNCSDIQMDDLALSQFAVLFPCIKYLALQYYVGSWNSNNRNFCINLPQVSLDRLTLDINTVKEQAKIYAKWKSNFSDECFILKVETSKKVFEYQVSLDFLNVNKMEKECESIELAKDCITLHILLKEIQCLEMYFLNRNQIGCLMYDCREYVTDNMPQRIMERRIYFE